METYKIIDSKAEVKPIVVDEQKIIEVSKQVEVKETFSIAQLKAEINSLDAQNGVLSDLSSPIINNDGSVANFTTLTSDLSAFTATIIAKVFVENADNTVENGYIIQLTDAEKLSLHMALQMQSALNGNPNILKILINKAAKMEKIPSNAAKN